MFTQRKTIFELEYGNRWVKYFFIVFIFGLGFFFIGYEIYQQSNYDYENEFYKVHLKDKIKAKVQFKIDNEWHRDNIGNKHYDRAVLRLSDSSEISYYSIYHKVNIGDSLIKEPNSKIIKIIKTDTIIYNDIYHENKFRIEIKTVSK